MVEASDFLSRMCFILIVVQTALYISMRLGLKLGVSLFTSVPKTAKLVIGSVLLVLCANYSLSVLNTNLGHFKALTYFTLLLVMKFNEDYANLLEKQEKATMNVDVLQKQAKQQAEAYMKLLNEKPQDEISDVRLRKAQEQIQDLKDQVQRLSQENEEMRRKGLNPKKDQ